MVEILAPAGSMEQVFAAIDAGADAIYLGGKLFNARKFAHNLDQEELARAVKTAHLFGVRIYVTVNIVIGDVEMAELTDYLQQLDRLHVDGIIVQDLAVAAIAHRVAPELPLHGSTQQTVADLAGVRFLESLGFTQVVLSRELSLPEIKEICAGAKAAIEVFVHGAECVCYSGQCLMSSFIGGRSGNRGACAQPCRLPYTVMKDGVPATKQEAYVLSLKDLNTMDKVHDLIDAGVASFKIEGRMKGSGYVHTVVQAYQQITRAYSGSHQDQAQAMAAAKTALADTFNRGCQSDFLADTVGRATITEKSSGNVGHRAGTIYQARENMADAYLEEPLADGDMVKIVDAAGQEYVDELSSVTEGAMRKGKRSYCLEFRRHDVPAGLVFCLSHKQDRSGNEKTMARKLPLYFHIDTDRAGKLRLTVWDEAGHADEETADYTAPVAVKRPADLTWVRRQLDRLGDTVFAIADVTMWDETHMIPASVLNELRREAVQKIETAILAEYVRPEAGKAMEQRAVGAKKQTGTKTTKMQLAVRCDTVEGVTAAIKAGADRIIYGGDTYDHNTIADGEWQNVVRLAHQQGTGIWAATPRILRQRNAAVTCNELQAAVRNDVDGIYAGALGIFTILQEMGVTLPVNADWSLNIFNSEAAAVFTDLGCAGLTLSPEMTLRQIKYTAKKCAVPIEVLAEGRLEMMVMEFCPIAAFAGNGKKKDCPGICRHGVFTLKDRRDEQFPLVTDQFCRSHILNSRDLDMTPYFRELCDGGIAMIRIEGRGRDTRWIHDQVTRYRRLCDGTEQMLLTKEDQTVTRGHFFHGIM